MITAHSFGSLQDGRPVTRFRLQNTAGAYADILTYGGAVQSLALPGQEDKPVDVALGYATISAYEAGNACMGAALGRYANRICGARYTLDGQTFTLPANDGVNCLHGGPHGFHRQPWEAETDGDTLLLSRVSQSGEEGFGGELTVRITYTLAPDNALCIRFRAEASEPTALNLSNHCYFNLAGHAHGSIAEHLLQIRADAYTETGAAMATTGRILPVEDTALDFRLPKPIGRDMQSPLLAPQQGYDHNFVLRGQGLQRAAAAWSPQSGIYLALYTDAPGLQLYTANFLSGPGKAGARYAPYSAFCLEAQSFPDAPNQPRFPAAILRPGEIYGREIVYALGVSEGFPD